MGASEWAKVLRTVDTPHCGHHLNVVDDEKTIADGCSGQNATLGKRVVEGSGLAVDKGTRIMDSHACLRLGCSFARLHICTP